MDQPHKPDFDPHALRVLEYARVIDHLAEYASTELGRERCLSVQPTVIHAFVRELQQETSEARRLIDEHGRFPFGGIHDIRRALQSAHIGQLLLPLQLIEVANTIVGCNRLKAWVQAKAEKAPLLAERADAIVDSPMVTGAVDGSIGRSGDILDSASPALAAVRSRKRMLVKRIDEKLSSILSSSSTRTMLMDTQVVERDGRRCLNVKVEHKRVFQGLVHGLSATGQTAFIEPIAVVEANNELREAEAVEQREMDKVLQRLTELVKKRESELESAIQVAGGLDLACAKGEYAIHLDACEPLLNHKGRIDIRQGRHPLLDPEKCVPVTVRLGATAQALLITGPNTGGKTVTLKTLGLFTIMAQSGLQVPCQSGSELAMFEQVFADIGDEQSIAQNLSTFSGHVANIVRILKVCGRRALVLLDELGSGTDPAEGAALAKSILTELLAHNARIVATTHYGELKEFAYSRDGVENAAVEFDVETLKPTYRLLQGVPGSSNAFHIARRLGMPNRVVDAAVASLGSAGADAAEVMLRLEAAKKAAEDEQREAERLRKELSDLRAKHAKRLEDLERLRAEAKERASEEARLLIRQKTEKMDNIISELRRMGKEGRKTQSARKKMKETSEELVGQIGHEKEPPPVDEADIPTALAKGDTVRVTSLGGVSGVVVENTSGSEAIVQVGVMRVTVPMTGLRIVGVSAAKQKPKPSVSSVIIPEEPAALPPAIRSKAKVRAARDAAAKSVEPQPEKVKKTPRPGGLAPRAGSQLSSVMIEKASSFSHELMLIGLRVDAALPRLDKWLDDAVLAGLDGGRVVHGKGTGALKRAVWEQLSGDPRVVAYQLSHPDEGGAGVTVIRFA